ncbi:MAG TPA: hypothetical protein VFT37_10660 [Telluria sp.]|nr:hypothetical protein [Telluria sp.]
MPRISKVLPAAALSCAAVLLSGCATPCLDTVEPGRYVLTKGVPTPLSPSASLTLTEVEDSRCPAGVQCVWAGRLAYVLSLQSCAKSETFKLTQDAGAHIGQRVPARVSLAPGKPPPPRSAGLVSPVTTVEVDIAAY